MVRLGSSLFIVLFYFLHTAFAYTFRLQTRSLAGGDTFFYGVIVDNGDVDVVDVLLVSSQRGNSTTILENFTMKTGDNQSFKIPSVPAEQYMIRLVQASNKQFILDSVAFEVTGTSSANSSTTSLPSPSGSTGSNVPTDDTTSGKVTQDGKKSGTGAGAIAGGVVGGLVALGVVAFALLCWRRKGRGNTQIQDLEGKKLGPSDSNPNSEAGKIDAFTIPHRPTLPSLDEQSGLNSVAGTVPSKLVREYAAIASTSGTTSLSSALPTSDTHITSNTALPRADHLRSERERINREIATLEQVASVGSGSSTHPGSGSVLSGSDISSLRPSDSASAAAASSSRDREISQQLAALQEQIRQLEARQVANEPDFSIPPPVYDGPPVASVLPVPITMPVPQTAEESLEGGSEVEQAPEFPNPISHPIPAPDTKTPRD